jgi:hypothetical protein
MRAGCGDAEDEKHFAVPPDGVVDQVVDEDGGEVAFGSRGEVALLDGVQAEAMISDFML